jgi:hypothetical protein
MYKHIVMYIIIYIYVNIKYIRIYIYTHTVNNPWPAPPKEAGHVSLAAVPLAHILTGHAAAEEEQSQLSLRFTPTPCCCPGVVFKTLGVFNWVKMGQNGSKKVKMIWSK